MKSDNTVVRVVFDGGILSHLETIDNKLLVPLKKTPPPGTMAGPDLVKFIHTIPANRSKWSDPVHVAFANSNFEAPEGVVFFVKHYGISGYFCRKNTSGIWFVDPTHIRKWQTELRDTWCRKHPRLWFHPRSLSVSAEGGHLQLVIDDLWALICIEFLIDHSAGRTRVCAYDDCKSLRYFVRSRKDQEFCSKSCRAQHNMKVWRSKPANVKHEKLMRKKRLEQEQQ
jgi:hypothetical protein